MKSLASALAGRYRLERELGAGGMATVYLAQDLRHERQVAIKVLRPELAALIGAQRFLAEIKTTANLHHPHILPLHDSGEVNGTVFYVMPFVEGESLRDRITREHQLPVEDAVRLGGEVADALGYAHRQGVIHRDIKPENILLHGGHAMVADFGIALAASHAEGGARLTETGMSLGTPHYMSPEQASGERTLDARSDIYSLGCVVYEMLVGEPPFTGPTAQVILARVMTGEPRPVGAQRKTVPEHIETAVDISLSKLPADRFPSAEAFRAALAGETAVTRRTTRMRPAAVVPRTRTAWAAWVVAVAASALALWGWYRPREQMPLEVERFSLSFPVGQKVSRQPGKGLALSPDGSELVYVGQDSAGKLGLYQRRLDMTDAARIPNTDGATQPFFSADGRWLGFIQQGHLRKVLVQGGSLETICDVPDGSMTGAAWGRSGLIVLASGGNLYRVSVGGRPEILARPAADQSEEFRWPDFLPDDRQVVFTLSRAGVATLAVASLEDGSVRSLNQAGLSPAWIDAGFLVFTQTDKRLAAVRFDPRRLAVTGQPTTLAQPVVYGAGFAAKVAVSRHAGSIAYLAAESSGYRNLVLVDQRGVEEILPFEADRYLAPRFSPDGKRIAVTIGAEARGDLWILDRQTGKRSRVTFDSASSSGEWTSDGRHLTFTSRRTRGAVYRITVDGSGVPESLIARPRKVIEAAITLDGGTIVFREGANGEDRNIWTAPVGSSAAAKPLVATPFDERDFALSPDGLWLAYVSNDAGPDQVYIRRMMDGSPRWPVSAGRSKEPRWARGGHELFCRLDDSLFAVPLTLGAEPVVGTARGIGVGRGFDLDRFEIAGAEWDVTADGGHFLFTRSRDVNDDPSITLVLHWFDALRGETAKRP